MTTLNEQSHIEYFVDIYLHYCAQFNSFIYVKTAFIFAQHFGYNSDTRATQSQLKRSRTMILPSKERRSCVAYTVVCVAVGLIIAGTILAIAFISTPVKTVETGNGLVRGSRHTSLRKKVEFFAFRGIPYAKPPVGDLRLKVFMGTFSGIFLSCIFLSGICPGISGNKCTE